MSPWRRPLLHFLLLGGALFGVEAVLGGASPPVPVLEVTAAQTRQLREDARRALGREPSAAELEASVGELVDEELLVRAARELGWHRSDPVVQRRLLMDMRFLGDAGEDEDLLDRAFSLGLDRSDLVVRRRLAERVRLAVSEAADRRSPSEAELAGLLARSPERFRRPARVRLTHVFLSRDRRGPSLAHDARALLAQLARDGVAPEQASELGDPFLLPAHLPLWSEDALAARLGPDFAHAAVRAPAGRWSGPVASSYGLHAVWVHEREAARLPDLEEVRPEVEALWRSEQERRALREALTALREQARVRIDWDTPPPGAG